MSKKLLIKNKAPSSFSIQKAKPISDATINKTSDVEEKIQKMNKYIRKNYSKLSDVAITTSESVDAIMEETSDITTQILDIKKQYKHITEEMYQKDLKLNNITIQLTNLEKQNKMILNVITGKLFKDRLYEMKKSFEEFIKDFRNRIIPD